MKQQARLEKARKAYNDKQATIHSLVGKLQDELKKHGEEEHIHWGHVGDLGHVQEQLQQIVQFLSNEE